MSGNNSRHWNDRNADKEAKYSVDSDEETNTASGSSVSKTESKFVMERQAVKGRGMRNSVHDANSRRPISNVRGTAHASNICSSIMVTEKARRPDHGNDGNRQLQMLGYRELQTMLTLDDKNLLIQVSGKIKNLEKLLNADKIRIDLMLLLLNAFGKCFQENIVEYYREHVTKLLALLIKSNKFRSHVVTFLTDGFTQGEKSQKVLSALSVILNIGELMCNVFPANVADVFTGIIPLMEAFIKSAGNDGFTVETEIVVKIDNLHKNVQRASRTTGDTPRMKKFEMESVQQPPNDFREIQVIPTAPELLNLDRPFIRRNLISGKYVDLNHYLDVHYRLLRHDFVAPLREGIAHYLDPSACRSRKWNKSVRIYENVYVLGSDLTKQGALFYFRLDENFLKRKLNFSKRLMTGSLVCLSKDRFETMSIGVVVDRKPEILQKGWIGVKIEISPEMIIEGCSKSFVFTMVESCSYFEAYRHVLERMKQITEDQILLHPCIVKCDSTGEPPDYLDESINYDFTSVCQRKPSSASIAVLHERQWPTADNLGLDEAQEAAMKMCIKNKVAIIQGPPGTGKTFLGLKVAKLLLNNSNIWSSDGSMLVVCYTNHALDQFLEGIMKFNRSIIRIGGRSKSESLMPYQLNAIRSEFPRLRGYGADRYQIIERQDEIKKTIEHLDQTITNCKKCILDEGKLYEKNVIDFSQHRYIELSGGMLLWLAVDSFYFSDSSDYSSMDNGNNSNEPENFDEDLYIDSDENDDISFEMEDGHDKKPNAEYLIRKFMPSKSEPLYSDPIQLLNDGWMQQGSKRDHKRRLQRLLNNEDVMSEEEANSVDVSRIHNLKDRWRLYRYWVKLFIQDVNAEIIQSHESYWREVNALQELNELKDLQVLKKAKVIGVTTTGAAKYWRLLQQLNLPVMIVEEAAEVFEAHIITALGRNTKHLILIGDHQQLRPSPAVYELAKKYNLDVSLFERLIKNDVDHVKLITQHRMRPEIARLICPHIYDRLLNHRSVTEYPKVAGVTSDVYFIDHRHAESDLQDASSKSNEYEAEMICELARYLILQNYSKDRISIITTYSGQLFMIKDKMIKMKRYCSLKEIRLTTVDNYQGEENDIILLSLVRSNEESKIGFLKTDNRICVALSRAKHGLYCIGNMTILAQNSVLFSQIKATLTQHNQIGSALRLECQNHPGTFTEVSEPKDFSTVPEGGCGRLCETRLQCGHTCTRACHVYDSSHEEFECKKICSQVVCVQEHKCQARCHKEKCKPCQTLVIKVIPRCHHEQMVPCSVEATSFKCQQKCSKVLSCGHVCKLKCGDACLSSPCKEMIEIPSPCGHTVYVRCGTVEYVLLYMCKEPCNDMLICEHTCSGTCGKCHQGRIHIACNKPCGRTLICGHACESNCSNCPPCKKPCENMCPHSKCSYTCGVQCVPCREKCNWSCEHFQCTRLCYEPCDRQPCNEPCKVKLPCGHPCIGMCGEPCPDKCRICNKDEVQEIIFGNEDEPDARFVQLDDCKHVIEVDAMDAWMDPKSTERDASTAIMMKACPRCKTVIRRTLRYKNIVNLYLGDVERVKCMNFGDTKHNKLEMSKIKNRIELEFSNCPSSFGLSSLLSDMLEFVKVESKKSTKERITYLQNLCLITFKFLEKCRKLRSNSKLGTCDQIKTYMYFLCSWLEKNMRDATVQQLKEFTNELTRFILFVDLKTLAISESAVSEVDAKRKYKEAEQMLLALKPLDDSAKCDLRETIKKITKSMGGLKISEIERIQIIRAMGLSPGHYFKCPNGHIYAIGECGGAMETSKCPECKEVIGGRSHKLTEGNKHAREMDRSKHPAWSDANNMRNYRF